MSLLQFLQISLGAALGILVALAARRAGTLTQDGTWAAALLGAVVFGLGGWQWAVLLLAFFLSSSGLSRAFATRKRTLSEKFSKGSRRDAAQVLANGGLAGAFVLAHLLRPEAVWPWLGFAGALAAVNADTWATELGVLSRARPVLISSGKPVEKGTSGGVTPLGTLATLGGAALLGALAGALSPAEGAWILGSAATFGGVCGSLLDSLLGATRQAIFYCPHCEKETEHHPLHTCGTPTRLRRGLPWLNNDLVNLAASLTGAAVAVFLWSIMQSK